MNEYKTKTIVKIENEKLHYAIVVSERDFCVEIQNVYNDKPQGQPYVFDPALATRLIDAIKLVAACIESNKIS